MDVFDTKMKEFRKLPKAEQDKITEQKKAICPCPSCPTYTRCSINQEEKLFCMLGKSFMCISFQEGCICPECQVSKDMGLRNKYFCIHGDEKGQRYEKSVWGSTLVE